MEEQEAEDTPSNDRRQRTPREGSYREDRVVDTPAREQGKMLDETYGGMIRVMSLHIVSLYQLIKEQPGRRVHSNLATRAENRCAPPTLVSSLIGGLIRQTIRSPRVGHWPPL